MPISSADAQALGAHGVDPDTIKAKLLLASLFLAAYEVVREQIVERTRWFFSDHYTAEGPKQSEEYTQRILQGHPNAFAGSVAWLKTMEVLTDADADKLLAIRDLRNKLVHELPAVLFGKDLGVDAELLNSCRELVLRVGRFWARADIDIDEDLAGQEITDEDIQPGASVMLEYITQIAVEAIVPPAT